MISKNGKQSREETMNIKGTKTEQNLKTAFAGESQARNKYSFYARQAQKEGLDAVAQTFETLAENERAHAKIWFKLLHDGMPNTKENLKDAIAGEHYETSDMYRRFAEEAREEGLIEVAALFEAVGRIESDHEAQYKALLDRLETQTLFKQETKACWVCLECGNVYYGETAPLKCPVCGHDQGMFVLRK